VQGTAAVTRPSATLFDGADALRERTSARMRELLSERRGGVYELVEYHLGWRDERGDEVPARAGKMLRPLLCLTVAAGYGTADAALDAAASIELLHAFSLVHDDIEDGDAERHHRPTLWTMRGVPLAINAGDSLFALAQRALIDATPPLAQDRALFALRIFNEACLAMIEGQHRDIEFESRQSVGREEYLEMTAGKTGALIGASLALGALFAGAAIEDVETLRRAGVDLGIAFQAVDDTLAAWGDSARTGKPVGNDAERGKKSLPAIITSEREATHARADASVRDDTLALARDYAGRALATMESTQMARDALANLRQLVAFILGRES
jgi:geranylgeranyl diphosphate synthase type I